MKNLFKYSKLVFNTNPASPDEIKDTEPGEEMTSASPKKTDEIKPRVIMTGINKRVDDTLGGLTIEEIDRRMDARIEKIIEKKIKEKILKGEKGEKGDKGDPGPKGDAMKFSDLSDGERKEIKGEKGDSLKFEDLTDAQKAELKGQKGEIPDFGALDEEQKKKLKQLMIDLGFGGIDIGLGGADDATKKRLEELEAKVAKISQLEASLQTLEEKLNTITNIDPQLLEDIKSQLRLLKDLNVDEMKDIPGRLDKAELSLGSLQNEVAARSDDLERRLDALKKLTDDYVDSDADNKDRINELLRDVAELERTLKALSEKRPSLPEPQRPPEPERAPRPPRAPRAPRAPRTPRVPKATKPETKEAPEVKKEPPAKTELDISSTKRLKDRLKAQLETLLKELGSVEITNVSKKVNIMSRIEIIKTLVYSEEILDPNARKNLSSRFLRLKKTVAELIHAINRNEDYTKKTSKETEIQIPNRKQKIPETINEEEEYTKTPNPIPNKKRPEISETIKKDTVADAKEPPAPSEKPETE